MTDKSNLIEKRRQKMVEMKNANIDLFPNDYRVLHTISNIIETTSELANAKNETGPIFTTAGRMMAINRLGKASFIRFRDRTGQLQAYIRNDKIGDEAYTLFKKLDIGDFIGLNGRMFITKTGEQTLLVEKFKLITKATRPLPEKFHSLKDPEKRYRQRYVDLIMNADVRNLFIKRSRIIQEIRNFLLGRDFLEVETPMMQPLPGGAEAAPFKTYHNALGTNIYLRIAPELYLKRLIVGGFERVFEINRNFRNEGVSTRHNPEFTMLEFYQAYANYEDLMDVTEEMFCNVAIMLTGDKQITYQGNIIDLTRPWRRLTLIDALTTIGGVDPDLINNKKRLIKFAGSQGIAIDQTTRLGKVITKLFDALVEPQLIQPTFITDYPVEVSPLSRRCNHDPNFTDRFELFIGGHEIANGFSELNDPEDQNERFIQQSADRDAGEKEAHRMDTDYIRALEYGMPPTAGEGIGIDRMTMLFTDAASIREVILFPHMKVRKG